jgi:predicted metalloendopeptidase
MVTYLKTEFDEILHKTDWMDEETKSNAYRKSQMMKAIVGYPDELTNDALVNEHYKTVSFKQNSTYSLSIAL